MSEAAVEGPVQQVKRLIDSLNNNTDDGNPRLEKELQYHRHMLVLRTMTELSWSYEITIYQ